MRAEPGKVLHLVFAGAAAGVPLTDQDHGFEVSQGATDGAPAVPVSRIMGLMLLAGSGNCSPAESPLRETIIDAGVERWHVSTLERFSGW